MRKRTAKGAASSYLPQVEYEVNVRLPTSLQTKLVGIHRENGCDPSLSTEVLVTYFLTAAVAVLKKVPGAIRYLCEQGPTPANREQELVCLDSVQHEYLEQLTVGLRLPIDECACRLTGFGIRYQFEVFKSGKLVSEEEFVNKIMLYLLMLAHEGKKQ